MEDLKNDKMGGNPLNGNEGVTQINSIKQAYNLIDPFRHKYKDERSFTWSCETTGVKTRLDRFYINKDLVKNIVNVKNVSCNVSDHIGVKIEFSEFPKNNFNLGKGVWKFNISLLKDSNFTREIEQEWNRLITTNNEINGEWWEIAKENFRKCALKHSKIREKNYRQQLREFENGIHELEALLSNCNNDNLRDIINEEKNTLKNQIDILYNEKYQGALVRSRCDILTNNENPSSNFLRMESKNGNF